MELVSDEKRALFHSYAITFENNYLLDSIGQQHLAVYEREREDVVRFWAETKKARQVGEPITALVLEKLLPYANTPHNRRKGYRISVAPAITRDLRKWFENAGWQRSDNWDSVASSIYQLVYDLIENEDWSSLARFEKDPSVSRGIKAGFITPTFYFLNSRYRIVNNKTIDTVNFLLGRNAIGRDLSNYRDYLTTIDESIEELDIGILKDADVFDAFCHWMCDKRLGGYARIEKTPEAPPEPPDEEEGPPRFDKETVPQNHWEAIYYIVKAGNLLGFRTYVADTSRDAYGTKLGSLATLLDVPTILKSAPEISRVDVIWYKPTPPFFFFEVEDGGTMREALHRLYNAMAFDARFFIVSPIDNRSKFEKWVTTAPFKEYEDRYNFRTYLDLFDFYQEAMKFTATHKRFLRL